MALPALPAAAPAPVAVADPQPLVALTFDDGPDPATTAGLLDGLRDRGAHATFFLIGKQIGGNEELVCRMVEEGHQLGIHSYDHVPLAGLGGRDFYLQVGREADLLTTLTGEEGFPLRPPYGTVDTGVKNRAGAPIVLWSIDPEDWRDKDTGRVVEHVVSRAQDGDIVLLHDIYPTSVEAALAIVDTLQARGFRFVTVAELAESRGVEPAAGRVYRNFYP